MALWAEYQRQADHFQDAFLSKITARTNIYKMANLFANFRKITGNHEMLSEPDLARPIVLPPRVQYSTRNASPQISLLSSPSPQFDIYTLFANMKRLQILAFQPETKSNPEGELLTLIRLDKRTP